MTCPFCIDASCHYGSVCFSGLADPSGAALPTGMYRDTKQHSQRNVFEAEHMFPGAALRHSGMAHQYATEPTYKIAHGVHYGAISGAGGGITSTGSSSIAQEWSRRLAQAAQVDLPGAIRMAALDAVNAHIVNDAFTQDVAFAICQTVSGHAAPPTQRITAQQAGLINNEVMDRFFGQRR